MYIQSCKGYIRKHSLLHELSASDQYNIHVCVRTCTLQEAYLNTGQEMVCQTVLVTEVSSVNITYLKFTYFVTNKLESDLNFRVKSFDSKKN